MRTWVKETGMGSIVFVLCVASYFAGRFHEAEIEGERVATVEPESEGPDLSSVIVRNPSTEGEPSLRRYTTDEIAEFRSSSLTQMQSENAIKLAKGQIVFGGGTLWDVEPKADNLCRATIRVGDDEHNLPWMFVNLTMPEDVGRKLVRQQPIQFEGKITDILGFTRATTSVFGDARLVQSEAVDWQAK